MKSVLEIIEQSKLVAVVRVDDLSRGVALAEALLAGGINALELTLTNPEALRALSEIIASLREFSDGRAVIGAGTVLNAAQALASIEAGAQFIVSPTTNLETIKLCNERDIAVLPGALTPTEILAAWEAGADAVKVFPAHTFGPSYLKSIREPLPQLKLVPTGGVNLDNVGDYLKNGALAVGIGGNLVDKKQVAAGDWESIRHKAAAYAKAVRSER